MKKIINECCACATDSYMCLGSACPNRNVPVWYCDKCDPKCLEPLEDVYEADGKDLCENCLLDMFRKDIDRDVDL